jgi:hypothetical protein
MTKQIINCETGEIFERELTQEELIQQEKDTATAIRIQEELDALNAEALSKRFVALAKLEALGLNEADLKALGL